MVLFALHFLFFQHSRPKILFILRLSFHAVNPIGEKKRKKERKTVISFQSIRLYPILVYPCIPLIIRNSIGKNSTLMLHFGSLTQKLSVNVVVFSYSNLYFGFSFFLVSISSSSLKSAIITQMFQIFRLLESFSWNVSLTSD